MRFSEIAVWTDPQLESSIDQQRQDSSIAYSKIEKPGVNARLLDKLSYNKAAFILDKISRNYLQSISPDFLFVSGDPNQRHSPRLAGEFYRIEFITVIFGLIWLLSTKKADKNRMFILAWLILAPIPAALTREGGTHASRLFLFFPVLSLISASGLVYLASIKGKLAKVFTCLIVGFWIFGVIFHLNYYFGSYKIEAAKFFQYGFSEAADQAISHKNGYKYVIIDDRKDSALMNYLFRASFNPADFQSKRAEAKIGPFQADKLDNVYLMRPGRRDWYKVFEENLINEDYLLIASADQLEEQTVEKLPARIGEDQKVLNIIYYQNGDPAFYVIEHKSK